MKYLFNNVYHVSAYCGSLWLAALCCSLEIAKIFNDTQFIKKYTEILKKGKDAFQDKLWNGKFIITIIVILLNKFYFLFNC